MSVIVDFRSREARSRDSYAEFCKARQDLIRTLQVWCSEHPPLADILDELDGTNNLMACSIKIVIGTFDGE